MCGRGEKSAGTERRSDIVFARGGGDHQRAWSSEGGCRSGRVDQHSAIAFIGNRLDVVAQGRYVETATPPAGVGREGGILHAERNAGDERGRGRHHRPEDLSGHMDERKLPRFES